jgi:hypothetical protein
MSECSDGFKLWYSFSSIFSSDAQLSSPWAAIEACFMRLISSSRSESRSAASASGVVCSIVQPLPWCESNFATSRLPDATTAIPPAVYSKILFGSAWSCCPVVPFARKSPISAPSIADTIASGGTASRHSILSATFILMASWRSSARWLSGPNPIKRRTWRASRLASAAMATSKCRSGQHT